MFYNVVLVSAIQQSESDIYIYTHTHTHTHIYIYTLFFRFPSHLGHQGSLSRVPCAIPWVLISFLFYTR